MYVIVLARKLLFVQVLYYNEGVFCTDKYQSERNSLGELEAGNSLWKSAERSAIMELKGLFSVWQSSFKS